MADMDHLVDHIKQSGEYWEILTATGDVNRSRVAADKNKWIKEHVDPNVLITCTIKGRHKAVFANHNHVLIDDRLENIEAWTKAGGIGILHKNAQETIEKLIPLFFS
jgi:5'(3')-deoxyribonucleotidase